jgi:hypothetical protein
LVPTVFFLGALHRDGLRRALKLLEIHLTDNEFAAIWKIFDCDADGAITVQEFDHVMTKTEAGRKTRVVQHQVLELKIWISLCLFLPSS